jgi:hypothetical protein
MFEGSPINFQGFLIPSDNTVFLTILTIHVLAGLVCVVTGIMAMLAKKQAGLHPRSGTIYYLGLWIVFITATVIAIARWKEDYLLFILALLSMTSAFIGRMAIKKRWKRWSIYHITGMGLSYIILLTAFYVDNGKFLPVWRTFNPLVYWILPSSIGIPIILRTLLRHSLSKSYFGEDR